jgi:hypothetical protein
MFTIAEETYSEVKICMKQIFKEIEQIDSFIMFNNQLFELKFTFTADMKMINTVTGIKSSISNHPCAWCICNKKKLYSTSFNFSRKSKFNNAKHSRMHKSLLPKTIPIENIVVDVLHLFLRIGSKLLSLILNELSASDKEPISFKPKKHANLKRFVKFMNKKCKHSYHIVKDSKGKGFKGRTLRGTELMDVLEKANVLKLMPDYKHRHKLQEIINDFVTIIKRLRNQNITCKELEIQTSSWMKKYKSIYIAKHITPYMHAFQSHLHVQTRRHGHINLFNLEGLEKQNALTTKTYFRATNFKNQPVKQIMMRFMRIEVLEQRLLIVGNLIIGLNYKPNTL